MDIEITNKNHVTIRRINMLVAMIKSKDLDRFIDAINDNKGDLHVYWKVTPTEEEKNDVKAAWEILNESNVIHYVYTSTYRRI